nr:hypothetical protein [Tanacetum cinerariifolium]
MLALSDGGLILYQAYGNLYAMTDAETCADTEKSNSEAHIEILNVGEEQGEDVSNTMALVERTVKLDEDQARSDPDQINLMNPEGNWLMHDIIKPLPLGDPLGQVTIQTQYFFNKDLEYLILGDKERRNALSISKLKAAYYPNFRLDELVSSLWIESERDYDISAAYDILYWWFKRKEFYITRHSAPSYQNAVRSHMRILSIVSLQIRLHILKRDCFTQSRLQRKQDLEIRLSKSASEYLLYLQSKLNHLSGANNVYLFNALNLTQPRWEVTDFLFKEYYTIVYKPRAVIYKVRNNQKKMTRETEVHKFSDGTLTRILEKLDFMVKDYELFNFNPGMEHRIWSEVDKRRSQEFIKLI